MSRFDRWVSRISRRERRRPAFDQALLTDRTWRYASYRLRYLVLRVLLRAGLHLAEMMLFASVFSMEFLGPVILIRSATAVGVSLWWGGLEQLRERVRSEARGRQWPAVRRTIDAWLGWSLLLGGTVLVVGTTLVLTITDQPYGFSIFNG